MQSLQDRIRESVIAAIQAGDLRPGALIDEKTLADQFESSRTPVREALLMLAAQGLVTIVPRAGMFVHKPSAAELVAMFETLAEMEGVVARLATQRISSAGKLALSQSHEAAGVPAHARDAAAYSEANRAFHEVLYIAAANPFLSEQIVQLRRRLAIYWQKKDLINEARIATSYREHGLVVEAILSGQSDAAAEAMRTHISAGGKALADLVLLAEALEE